MNFNRKKKIIEKLRNAIKILEINEYPELIIQEALRITDTLDKSTLDGNV